MPKRANLDAKSQHERFVDAAREADCDVSVEAFESALKAIAKAKPAPKPTPKSAPRAKSSKP